MGNACALCSNKSQKKTIQAQSVTAAIYQKKEIKNGFGRIYAGVRHDDKKYTSPVLALHLWSKDSSTIKTHGGTIGVVNQPGGLFSTDRSNSMITNTNQRQESKFALDETIQMIPLEDIISIVAQTEVKRATAKQTSRRLKTPPPEDLSCCGQTKKWCVTKVCCCCCSPTVTPAQVVETSRDEQSATRTIIVKIKHVVHSNVHTPSNIQVLDAKEQHDFYKKKFEEETIKFYYLHNDEVNEANFNSKMREAEALARVITQIKALKPHYPDPAQLQEIFRLQEVSSIGFQSDEHMTTGTSGGTTATVNLSTVHET